MAGTCEEWHVDTRVIYSMGFDLMGPLTTDADCWRRNLRPELNELGWPTGSPGSVIRE